MDSGQESQLETERLGFCMMSSKPKEPTHLFQRTWKARTIVKAQRNPRGCFPRHSRFSMTCRLQRLAPRPPIVLYSLHLVLDECLREINKVYDQSYSFVITPFLSFKKYTKTERHSLPELKESTRISMRPIDFMMLNCSSPSISWFTYTRDRNNSVWLESSLWTLIAFLASFSEEVQSFMQTLRNCCSTQSEATTSRLHIVCSMHSGLPAPCNLAKSKQRTTPTTYSTVNKGVRFILQAQRLLTAQFAVGKHMFSHGTKYSWWSVITASEDMKKTNLTFHLCSMLSVNLIPQWKLFTSQIQATP